MKIVFNSRSNNPSHHGWIIKLNQKISDLLSTTFEAGSVLVPSQGWLIYGGLLGSTLTSAQKLVSLDDKWEAGPHLFEEKPDRLQCLVQV